MAGTELATAYLTLIPSLKGASKSIGDQLGGIDTSAAGKRVGESFGKSIGSNLNLGSAGGALEKLGDELSSAGDALTTHVTLPIAAAGAAIGTFALKTASAAETTEISFTTMLGSEEAALSMMERLADFAAHTPFELSGLQTATRQLLAYGFTAEDVIPMLTAVGDATAALGTGQAGIEAVTRALGQMRTRGKASAEEMLQLTEAGIPAWKYLAQAIGTDTAGAMDAVSEGAVDADTAIRALTEGMERDFGGMMEEQSKTVEGLMSNLADAIEQPLMALRESDAYERFADALGKVVDAAGPFVESLLPHMEDGIDIVSDVLDAAADAMEGFSKMSRSSQAEILKLVAAAAAAGPALKVIGPAVKAIGTAMKSAGSATSILQGGLVGIAVAAAAFVAIDLVSSFAEAEQHEKLLTEATMDFEEVMGRAGSTAEQAGDSLSRNIDSVLAATEATEDSLRALADLGESASETIGDFQNSAGMLDVYISTIERLAGQSGLTATEQERLKQAVDGYNEITGNSVEVTDAANGRLSESTEQLRANAEAWYKNAEAQAYQSVAQQYLEEQIELSRELEQAQDDLAEAQRDFNAALESGDQFEQYAAGGALEQAQENVDELSAALDSATDNWNAFSAQGLMAAQDLAEGLPEAVESLPEEMQVAGVEIASALSAGVESGSVTAGEAASYLSDTVKGTIDSLPGYMQQGGMAAAQSLASAIASGQISVSDAATILNAVVTGSVDSLPESLRAYGTQAYEELSAALMEGGPVAQYSAQHLSDISAAEVEKLPGRASAAGQKSSTNFASGIGSKVGLVKQNAAKLSDAASSMGDGDSYTWGSHLGRNFAAGLGSALGSVASNALALAREAASKLHFSVPKEGPWSGSERGGWTSGLHLGENFARGMFAAVPAVASASIALADAAAPGYGPMHRGDVAIASAGSTESIDLLRSMYSLLADIYDVIPEGMTKRKFGRACRRAVVNG